MLEKDSNKQVRSWESLTKSSKVVEGGSIGS